MLTPVIKKINEERRLLKYDMKKGKRICHVSEFDIT